MKLFNLAPSNLDLVLSSLGDGLEFLGQVEPVTADAPEEVKAPLRKVGALVKWIVIAVIAIGGVASLGSVIKSFRSHESPAQGFTGVVTAAIAIAIAVKIESIFNWIA